MDYQPNISILIADDESSIRNGLLSAIPWDELHMTVLGTAKDGMEAWSFIQSCHPEIVITDIRMPHLNGLELIKRCRDYHLDIQFILLSGYDDFTYAQTAIRYGARAYVLKPLKREELIAELENLAEELAQSRSKEQPSDRPDSRSFQELSCRLFFNQLIHNEFH
ncbi:MAG: response regulator, partial [Hungatella sp.]